MTYFYFLRTIRLCKNIHACLIHCEIFLEVLKKKKHKVNFYMFVRGWAYVKLWIWAKVIVLWIKIHLTLNLELPIILMLFINMLAIDSVGQRSDANFKGWSSSSFLLLNNLWKRKSLVLIRSNVIICEQSYFLLPEGEFYYFEMQASFMLF